MDGLRKVLIIVALFLATFTLFKWVISIFEENKILQTSIRQQEAMLKEKDNQINQLQAQLEELKKQQLLYEKNITRIKQKRQKIQRPKDEKEIVERFKNLGYEVRVKP